MECSSRNLQAAGFCKNRNILFETEKFCKNRKFLFETENFCLKQKISVKTENFCSKQKISVKTENFCQNRKVDEKALCGIFSSLLGSREKIPSYLHWWRWLQFRYYIPLELSRPRFWVSARLSALQTKLIRFRSNLDPDLTIGYDCSDFDRSNNHMTKLT